ncbi:hypothetical protein ANN_08221, partial [Periplaneta americana]
MAGLCEGGNEPSGSLKAICNIDSQLKIAAPFKRFGETNISEIEFHLLKCHGRRAAAPSSATSGLTSQLEHPAATTYAASQRLCSHDRRAQGLRTYATANEAGRSLRPYLQ